MLFAAELATPETTSATTMSGGIFFVLSIIYLAVLVFYIVCMWKIFVKAGKPGWASIVPIYNYVVLLEIVGRPIWWIFLLFIPIVNFVVMIMVYLDFAASYGKSSLFAILGLIFFPYIAIPMLAFGSAKYVGPAALAGTAPAAPSAPTPPPAAV
jgi:hypothetical protein